LELFFHFLSNSGVDLLGKWCCSTRRSDLCWGVGWTSC